MDNSACQNVIDRLEAELSLLRTGRYPPAIINGIVIEDILASWRGVSTALKFFCLVEVDAATRRVTVRSFDATAVDEVHRALSDALPGVSIARSGGLLRFDQPPLTAAQQASLQAELERLVQAAKAALSAAGRESAQYLPMADRLVERFRQEIATAR
ncbi:MAG: ribosome recycling factor [Phycisphaerae bacterium]